jgi:hypothetical protein
MKQILTLGFGLLLGWGTMAQTQNEPFDSAGELMQQESFAQEEIPDKNEAPVITLRPLAPDSVQRISAQPAYGYMRYIDSLLRARKAKNPPPPPVETSGRPGSLAGWWRGILWGLAVFVVLFVAYKLLAGQVPLFQRNKTLEPGQALAEGEVPGNVATLLEQAIAQKDYRQAVRLLFIHTLDLLAQHGHIALSPDKTNYHYLQQMQNKALQQAMAPLMLQYEYVWYGEFVPTDQQFHQIHQRFINFRQQWL